MVGEKADWPEASGLRNTPVVTLESMWEEACVSAPTDGNVSSPLGVAAKEVGDGSGLSQQPEVSNENHHHLKHQENLK